MFPSNQEGEAWLHWEYSAEEWARFDAIDWRPGLRLCLCLPIGLFVSIFFAAPTLVTGNYLLVLLGSAAITALATFFALWITAQLGQDKRRHQARKQVDQPRRVTFGKQGLWIGGVFSTFDNGLKKVRLTAHPPVLHFRSLITVSNGNSSYSGDDSVRVLVPRGHEDEAARLVQRYRTEVIEARQAQLERWRNPPEPR